MSIPTYVIEKKSDDETFKKEKVTDDAARLMRTKRITKLVSTAT